MISVIKDCELTLRSQIFIRFYNSDRVASTIGFILAFVFSLNLDLDKSRKTQGSGFNIQLFLA